MSSTRRHPEDLTPLAAGWSDAATAELREHVEGCSACREQVEEAVSLSALFRSADIEVPPLQWQRIEARLRAEQAPTGWLERIAGLVALRPAHGRRRFALSVAA